MIFVPSLIFDLIFQRQLRFHCVAVVFIDVSSLPRLQLSVSLLLRKGVFELKTQIILAFGIMITEATDKTVTGEDAPDVN